MAASFNAMLQRSMQDQPPPEPVNEAPGNPPPAIGRSLDLCCLYTARIVC